MKQFKEHNVYDLESFLGIDKNDHNLEDQIDNLKNQIELILDGKTDKDSFIEEYNDWVQERVEQE